jgi:anti-sigma regulatory factor (Ser/Thr protein kinase)
MHPDAQVISLNVPAGSASLAEVRSSIERLDDLDRETKATVKLLGTELVANSVRHARLDPSETVVVTLEIRPERVRAEVVDWGSGFAMPDDKAPKGRGFAIRAGALEQVRLTPQHRDPRLVRDRPSC